MGDMENEFHKNFSKIIAKAWSDPQFKERFLKNPENVLKEQGMDIPQGKKVTVVEDSSTQIYLILPEKPSGDLSEKDLESIAGAACAFSTYLCVPGQYKFH